MSRRPIHQPQDYPVVSTSELLAMPSWVCLSGPYNLPREAEVLTRNTKELHGTKWCVAPYFPNSHDPVRSQREAGSEPNQWGIYRHITEVKGGIDEDDSCD